MKDQAKLIASIPVRILLADDNALGLIARKSVLEAEGYRVTTASNGQEAMDLFRRYEFDIVITDYRMPKMDGLELIERIRTARPETRIILISGYAEALGMTEVSTGADAVIMKSASEVTHLTRSVQRILRRPAEKGPGSQNRTARAVRAV